MAGTVDRVLFLSSHLLSIHMYADDNGNGIETDGHVPHFAEWDHYSFVGGHGGRDGRVQREGEQKHPYPF